MSGILKRLEQVSHRLYEPNPNGSHKDRVMAPNPLPSQEVLRQLLRYEAESGKLFWLPRSEVWFTSSSRQCAESLSRVWNTKNSGKEAGMSLSARGYRQCKLFGVTYFVHRLIFKHAHDLEPQQIDHINRCRSDNRLTNLRAATPAQNAANYEKVSKAIYRGVTKTSGSNTWSANISAYRSKQGRRYIGSFPTAELAARAYDAAAIEAYGEFAVCNFPSALKGGA